MENKGPEFLRFMIPLINTLKKYGNAGKPSEIINEVIKQCDINKEELSQKLKRGGNRVKNQVYWARFYLVKDGFIDSSQKGIWKLTNKALTTQLQESEIYDIFHKIQQQFIDKPEIDDVENETPQEIEENNISIDILHENFFEKIDFENYLNYKPLLLGDPKRIKIQEIIKKCKDTKWVIPHFQRYFDWNKNNIKELLESVFYDYYVGSFLLWETSRTPELGIKAILGLSKDIDDLKPTEIILDGQQRITALLYAVTAPNIPIKGSKDRIYFYVNFQNFLRADEKTDIIEMHTQKLSIDTTYQRMLFPIFEVENYAQWIFNFEDYLLKSNIDNENVRKIRWIIENKLRHFWTGFEIPYISLPENMDLTQVTDIFENINTKGKLLSVFDLLIARLYKYDIEVKNIWDETLELCQIIKRYYIDGKIEKMPIYILQAMSLFYTKTSTSKRADILNIYSLVFENNSERVFGEDWEDMSLYMELALKKIENMKDGFGVRSEKDLPFTPMIPVLTALLKLIEKNKNKADCNKKINIWYWSAVFTSAYSSAADTQMTTDYKEMRKWFEDDSAIPKVVSNFKKEIKSYNFFDIQSTSNSKYKGILSLIALNGAKDFETSLTLQNAKKNDKDHIFPKVMSNVNAKYINSILNITWMSIDTNRKIKKYKNPSVYIQEFITKKYKNNENEFYNILSTHIISKEAYEFLKKDDFDNFINARQIDILNYLSKIIGIETDSSKEYSLITEDKPFSNKIAFITTLKECKNYIYWLDKYFSVKGLEFINQIIDEVQINEIKIIMSIEKAEEQFRKLYKDFKEELNNKKIETSLHVIIDSKTKNAIHDRFIISEDIAYNVPSPDIIARNQLSEIKKSNNFKELKIFFEKVWNDSVDIIYGWNKIIEKRDEINKKQ